MNRKLIHAFFFILILLSSHPIFTEINKDILKEIYEEGMTIDLSNPIYQEDTLTTTEGGVLTAKDIRIQAQEITFTNQRTDDCRVTKVIAEGNLILQFGCYFIVGDRLEYDFNEKRGILYNGRSGFAPWYFGGRIIELLPNLNLRVRDAFLTTSPAESPEWKLAVQTLFLTQNFHLSTKNIQLKIGKIPVFWLPQLQTNLFSFRDSPIRYRFRFAGEQGPRFGIIYEALSLDAFKAFVRFDYRLNRGPSGGLETVYNKGNQTFHTISYIARDSTIEEPSERTRWRLEGVYKNSWQCDQTSLRLTYDWLSDQEMPSDYYDKDLELETAEKTELSFHHQYRNIFLMHGTTRLRVNNFQTVKQELPSMTLSFHPYTIPKTGLLLSTQARAGYLDFQYSNDSTNSQDFHSARVELQQTAQRPIDFGLFTFTPEAEGLAIFYENSPSSDSKWLTLAILRANLNTSLTKDYAHFQHTLVPYIRYEWITSPTTDFDDHYIFDEKDGWHQLNTLRFGARNLVYAKGPCSFLRTMALDTFAYAFFETPTLPLSIPKAYAQLSWNVTPTMRQNIETAWDFERDQIDHFNTRLEWTWSESFAFAAEYRRRDSTSWRKAQPYNFILESARTESSLTNSPLSDRRDTFLFHAYYQMMTNLGLEFQLRQGWNRRTEPSYTEYQIDASTTLFTAWNLRLSFQRKEEDYRVAFYLSLVKPP